jgi:hypothetical protein
MGPVNVSGVGKDQTVRELPVMLTIVMDSEHALPNNKMMLQNLEIVYVMLDI